MYQKNPLLLEADNQAGVPVHAQVPKQNPYLQPSIGFNSLFKPFSISGITTKTRNMIMREGNFKLQAINRLTAKLKDEAARPDNKKKQEDMIKLQYAQQAYKCHHEFISKTLFWKSRANFNMGPQFLQLKEQYTRQLFMIEQAYKRAALKLNVADTSNY